jgi:hypothetical protein
MSASGLSRRALLARVGALPAALALARGDRTINAAAIYDRPGQMMRPLYDESGRLSDFVVGWIDPASVQIWEGPR